MYQLTLNKDEGVLLLAMLALAVGTASGDKDMASLGLLSLVVTPHKVHVGLSSTMKTLQESLAQA